MATDTRDLLLPHVGIVYDWFEAGFVAVALSRRRSRPMRIG
jgi:hypothetical protein